MAVASKRDASQSINVFFGIIFGTLNNKEKLFKSDILQYRIVASLHIQPVAWKEQCLSPINLLPRLLPAFRVRNSADQMSILDVHVLLP